ASAAGWVEFSNQKWGTNLSVDDYNENWSEMWGVDHEEGKKRAHIVYGSNVVSGFDPYDEALPVLQKLSKTYKLVIVTSRVSNIHEETLQWLERHYRDIFSEIHLAGFYEGQPKDAHIHTKAELCQQIGANYLIDDQPKHCLATAAVGIPALLFGNYAWSEAKNLPPGVSHVKNWQAVLEYFDGKAGA
ncbi:MAG TPA: hypothetical protein VFI84_01480, partial [Candidatus Saccharimonadales bacterium]|nr:hypothetical protein [Candidatus Saccharimonadales bacterium]